MNQLLKKYFAEEMPAQEQMYHLISGLLIIGFSTCLFVTIFFSMPWYIRALISCGLFVVMGLFFEDITDEEHFKVCVFMIYLTVLIIFPIFYVLSRGEALEAPLYYMSGLLITAYLVEDRWRRKAVILQLIVYFISFVLVFFLFQTHQVMDPEKVKIEEYIRVFVGIGMNGSYCSIVAHYRNRLIHDQMVRSSDAMDEARNYGYSKDIFLVNVSHDIRTPLNAIIGTCELLHDKDMNEETQENVEQILEFSKALLSITNNLLDFSKMDLSQITISRDVYDTTDMLNEIINMFAVQLLDSNIHFYPMIEANIPKGMIGDKERIFQIMINLISYAVKNTEEGDILFQVSFDQVDDKNGRLVFSVQDGGKCANTEVLKAALQAADHMDENQEEEEKSRTADTFMGVVNAKIIAKAMNGSIDVISEKEVGDRIRVSIPQQIENAEPIAYIEKDREHFLVLSQDEKEKKFFRFIFRQLKVPYAFVSTEKDFLRRIQEEEFTRGLLSQHDLNQISEQLQNEFVWFKLVLIGERNRPLSVDRKVPAIMRPYHVMNVCEALSGQKATEMKRKNRYSAYRCPSARIMVVDDNQINLEVAGGMLSRIGAQVTCVLSGIECLKKLETEDYDIILMDYMMPEMDGIDTLKNIKKMERKEVHEIPVLALTANAVSGSREMFLEAGFDDYISKPIEMKSFYIMIRKYLKPEQLEFN